MFSGMTLEKHLKVFNSTYNLWIIKSENSFDHLHYFHYAELKEETLQ
jgi:hypothetical protein